MIYDVFMFNGELDLLEVRLNEYFDVVDKFVIAESKFTYQGNSKPLYYQDSRSRFIDFKDKIIYADVTETPLHGRWEEERRQTQSIKSFLNCNDMDLINVCDADEIVKKCVFEYIEKEYRNKNYVFRVEMQLHYYYINCMSSLAWTNTIMPYGIYKNMLHLSCRHYPGKEDVRFLNGGFHFSYLGDTSFIVNKLESFSHTEYNTPFYKNPHRIQEMKKLGLDFLDRNVKFNFCGIDSSYPKYILDNIDKYKKLGWVKEVD